MDSETYVTFLVIGTVLVLIDGQIIYRNGKRFLQQATPNAPADSLTKLVTVLFHLGTLGVLALISSINVPASNQIQEIVVRLGVILIIIGIAHWIAISALSRIRDREEFDEVSQERMARRQANDAAMQAQGYTTTAAPGTLGATPPQGTPVPTENPYSGDNVTSVVNRQPPQQY